MGKVRSYKGRVSLYGGNFVIKVADNIADAFKSVPSYKYEEGDETNVTATFFLDEEANTINKRCYYLFFTTKATVADIVHECVHWKNAIFSFHEIKLDADNDEAEAYLQDHLVNYVFKKVYPSYVDLYKK